MRNISLFGVCKICRALQDSRQNVILSGLSELETVMLVVNCESRWLSVFHRGTRNLFPLIKIVTCGRILKRMQMKDRLAVDWIGEGVTETRASNVTLKIPLTKAVGPQNHISTLHNGQTFL